MARHAWLFSQRPSLFDVTRRGRKEWYATLKEARLSAVRELVAQNGLPALQALAKEAELPWEVGLAFGSIELNDAEENTFLARELASPDDRHRRLAFGFVVERAQRHGWEWVDDKLATAAPSWWAEQRAEFYACLPFVGEVWDRLHTAGQNDTQKLYS